VDAEEIGRLIGELENRVERLRSLYEQYFMGIERIEPLTLRKDVERRLWALRKEQIRNTGLRFKLETTIQRYNTYQQYWQRIVREIEAGTYQRDLGRAAQRFGDNVVTAFARRRQKLYEKGLEKKVGRDALRRTGPGASQAPPAEEAIEDAPPSSNESLDVTFEDSEAAEAAVVAAAAAPVPPAPMPPPPPPVPHEPLELEISEPAPPPPPRSPAAVPRAPFGAAASDPRRVTGPAAVPAARPPAAPQRPVAAGAPPVAPHAINPGPARPAQASGAAPPAYAVPPGAAAKPAPPPPRSPLASSPGVGTSQAKPVAAPKPAAPAALSAPKPAAAAAPAVPPARPPSLSRPDGPAPAVLSDDNGLSPIRMRQIYGQFVEAKRKANESTAAVTYEKIASNLESVAKELRAKHNARSVDFEVVMKNGKPVLKPVVKG